MKGVNLGGWFSQIDAIKLKDPEHFPGELEHMRTFLAPEDFARIRGWGFDHVRLPVDWSELFHANPIRPKEEVFALLDRAVEDILAHGLKIILDLHRCPGHDFEAGLTSEQSFFTDPQERRDCLRVWSVLAERYGNRKEILLELLNEPVAPSAQVWNEVKKELAGAIRALAPRSTLVVGSNLWNSASEFAVLEPLDDPNILYSVHFYNPILFTHQFAPWVPWPEYQIARPYPGTYELSPDAASRLPRDAGLWDKARLASQLEPVFRFRETYGVQVACNEFGAYMGGPAHEHRSAWLDDILDLFAENQVGWTYWNYKNLDFGLISRGESLFQDSPQYANPERLDRALLDRLLRPR